MDMKRTLYQWGAGIFFCLSALTACSDDDTPMEENILPPTPTVTLTAGETGYTTVNITLESTNALRCAYLVMEENEIMPDAQEVLDKGIVTTANKPMDIVDRRTGCQHAICGIGCCQRRGRKRAC